MRPSLQEMRRIVSEDGGLIGRSMLIEFEARRTARLPIDESNR
jgi:hypothetical protein